ncbi:MAG: gephyrin-like molybdotransferase Glp [Congregibacter sp.]
MSPTPPLALSEALIQLLDTVSASRVMKDTQTVPLADALGRVLADETQATLDVPPADNSAMDGYAVRFHDAGKVLPVAQRVFAGARGQPLRQGVVARIFTGAEIPPQADAVVMQEDVQQSSGIGISDDADADSVIALDAAHSRVKLPAHIDPGQHIRRRGQDCAKGELLLPQGRRLRPQDLGLLASQGFAEVRVLRKLKVALISTGSELREPGSGPLPPGAIYNSNRLMLTGLLVASGYAVVDLGIVPDSLEATVQALRDSADKADVIVSCGGVSVGEADFVRDAVAQLGRISLWRIAIKPGKPFAHGLLGSTHFIGLPGNPSSAFVTFLLLARPLLAALQGCSDKPLPAFPAKAEFSHPSAGSRDEYLRVSLRVEAGTLLVTPYANQSSGVLKSVSASNALALIPAGSTICEGDPVEVYPLDLLVT